MVRRNADRLIQAAEVAENLRPIGLIPQTESQARPLTRLEPEVQREVWNGVIRWWDERVSVRHGPGGTDRAKNADLRSLVSKDAAESDTGISQQQVSKWNKKLQKANKQWPWRWRIQMQQRQNEKDQD